MISIILYDIYIYYIYYMIYIYIYLICFSFIQSVL